MPLGLLVHAQSQLTPASTIFLGALGVVFLLVLVQLIWLARFTSLYNRAMASGVRLSLPDLIGMRLRKVDPHRVVNCAIKAVHSGVPLKVREIESHILAGGRPEQVVTALMLAREKGMPRSFSSFAAADLAGLDVVALVMAGREPLDAIGARRSD